MAQLYETAVVEVYYMTIALAIEHALNDRIIDEERVQYWKVNAVRRNIYRGEWGPWKCVKLARVSDPVAIQTPSSTVFPGTLR